MKVVAMLLVVAGMVLSSQSYASLDSKSEMRDGTVICKLKQQKEAAAQQRKSADTGVEKAADAR